MSNEINTGGPAFPCETVGQDEHGEYRLPWQGATLRDYFAAKAMPAVYSEYCSSAEKVGFDEGWMMGVAMDAYAMADAMIAAREKGGVA